MFLWDPGSQSFPLHQVPDPVYSEGSQAEISEELDVQGVQKPRVHSSGL